MNIDSFVANSLSLVSLEREAEAQESINSQSSISHSSLEKAGVAILKLICDESKTGLGGRTIATFVKRTGIELPATKISTGDIVAIRCFGVLSAEADVRGIVVRTTESNISIAVDEFSDILQGEVSIFKLANDVTYKRYNKVLNELQSYHQGPASRLKDVLFGSCEPIFNDPIPITPFNQFLNPPQIEAISFALAAGDIACIHGPPGTGKTTTVVELIMQAVARGDRVLACAPSNVAVDNMVEKLAENKIRIVRLGHPARLLPSVLRHSLDVIVQNSDNAGLARDVRKEMDDLVNSMKKSSKDDRNRIRSDLRHLRKELKQREMAAIKEVMVNSQVILCTNTGAADKALRFIDDFDLVVIDEAAQALEVSCWIPILRGKRCVLAGDHKQLSPTVVSKEAEAKGLGVTLFERVMKMYGEDVVGKMLVIQFRMHHVIMNWSSQLLYGGRLIAHDSVKDHLLKDLPHVADTELTETPFLLVDTTGCDLLESTDEAGSHANEGEVEIVVKHLQKLYDVGLKDADIGVITPYNAQVNLLRQRLRPGHPNLEIGTVDGFQGREKQVIVISMVRANPSKEVGFLSDDRRTNVAVTRAKRQVVIICDMETCSSHPALKNLNQYAEANAEIVSSQMYDDVQVKAFAAAAAVREGGQRLTLVAAATKKTAPKQHHKQQQQQQQQQHVRESGEEAATRKKQEESEIQGEIREFMESQTEMERQFSCHLSAYQRAVVHELAEKFNLIHFSSGEGSDRFITVRKGGTSQKKKEKKKVEANNNHDNVVIQNRAKASNVFAALGGPEEEEEEEEKEKNQDNDDDSDENGSDDDRPNIENIGDQQQQQQPKKKKKNRKKNKGNNGAAAATDELSEEKQEKLAKAQAEKEELNQLFKTMSRGVTSCFIPKCKNSIQMLARVCPHCRMKFCFEHSIPEAHGCGDAAKKLAREQWIFQNTVAEKERDRLRELGRTKPVNRDVLKNKLHQQIEKQETTRKPAKKK